jgi:hypothetical protein
MLEVVGELLAAGKGLPAGQDVHRFLNVARTGHVPQRPGLDSAVAVALVSIKQAAEDVPAERLYRMSPASTLVCALRNRSNEMT